MKKYIPSEIESIWQKKWQEDKLYKVNLSNPDKKEYILVEFSYPSGDLHMGHWFAFAVPDILARTKRMQGRNVFFPNGFDAFGLPAENAAIKKGVHPQDWTLANIERMKQQFATMGASFNWENEVITCLPEYYKWNQWIFLKMLEKGIAYRGKRLANWCPNDQTVLANENIEAGRCWRCGAEVIQKEIDQWLLKITDYAEKLEWGENSSVEWPKAVREGQNNWIGKSTGVLLDFKLEKSEAKIRVFTTALDTVFGVTFLVLSPEHPLVNKLVLSEHKKEVSVYITKSEKKTELERTSLEKDKTGVFTGAYCINPFNNKIVPIWIADYTEIKTKFSEKSELFDSGDFDGLTSIEAKKLMEKYIGGNNLGEKTTNYHLHDWSISRQRYWGTPIPIIHCKDCGIVPVPEKDLPVELPYEVDYAPKGKAPLATAEEWVNVLCPNCGKPALREVETMDTFFDSSWYFFRYLDPKNAHKIFDSKVVEDWLPLEVYFGGAEHTLGHTLYSRFFTKFFHDLGLISFDEYAKKRVNRGLILGPDGQKMSKSRGNVINPDDQVKEYGADAVRLYLAFIGPYAETVAPWDKMGLNGVFHFLQRVWSFQEKLTINHEPLTMSELRIMHKTIKKVTEDISDYKFNTAVSSLMEWINHLSKRETISKEEYEALILLLAPFAPHITEQIWQDLGNKYSIHQQSWPSFDSKYLEEVEYSIPIQVNGKLRSELLIQKDLISNKEVVEKMAIEDEKVRKFLDGKAVKKIVYIPGKIINLVV